MGRVRATRKLAHGAAMGRVRVFAVMAERTPLTPALSPLWGARGLWGWEAGPVERADLNNAPFLADPVIGGVDAGEAGGAEGDRLGGHALGDQPVGMGIAHDPAIGRLDRGIVHLAGDAEHVIRVGGIGAEMALADAGEIGLVEAEDLRDSAQIGDLRLAHAAVG